MSNGSRSPVFYAKSEDQEMEQAVARAVGSFKYLWRELTWEYRRIVPGLELSAIKAAFKDGEDGLDDAVEHMWLSDIEFDGDVISATLINSPNDVTSVRKGDQITLRKDQIEDWMYVIEGRVYGGFTVQVLRARMSSAERRGHDKAWGFDFAEPTRVDIVPNWQERGKKKLLGRLFATGEPPPGDPDAEHPMSENMADGLAEAIGKDRKAFFELGPAGLNTLHSLALGGSAAGVKVLLAAGADPRMKTRSGKTALELAAMMGWPRVVQLLRDAEAVG
jgi:uncharacterized protein YegJ (DUF2314 family)